MESSRIGTIEGAVQAAKANGWRQRAVCYVTRGCSELLVFEHEAHLSDSGVQLPAGGIDSGETPAQAAAREAYEETGLTGLSAPVHLGSCRWGGEGWNGPDQVWHYFQLASPLSVPDAWTHRVTGGIDDTGMLFHLRFLPLSGPDLTPDLGSHEYLPELERCLELEHCLGRP